MSAASRVKPRTNLRVSRPAGMARVLVRGLAASKSASAQRLKAMAQDRAATMATRIQPTVRQAGKPLAARIVAVRAKGRAKMECSHLIISSVVRVLAHKPGMLIPVYLSGRASKLRGGLNEGAARWVGNQARASASSTVAAMGITVCTLVSLNSSKTRGLTPAAMSVTPFDLQRT